MTLRVFSDLPTEILQRICCLLPPTSALTFQLACRAVYQACNHWAIWRAVTVQASRFPEDVFALSMPRQDGWKRYVVAVAKASRDSGAAEQALDTRAWMPQVAALFSVRLQEHHLSTLYSHFQAATCLPVPCGEGFRTWLDAWHSAHAAAFVSTMHQLSTCASARASFDALDALLPWGPADMPGIEAQAAEVMHKGIMVARHATATHVVGLVHAKACWLHTRATADRGFPQPPSASSLSLGSVMDLPLPFRSNSLQAFGQCHLRATTDPAFFVNREWTGLWCARGENPDSLDGVGGPHHDGLGRNPDGVAQDPLPGHFPHGRAFDGVIRFRFVHQSSAMLRVESNNFHTRAQLHHLCIDIYCETGRVEITHWHFLTPGISEGVITPFGIISQIGSGLIWIWLWPSN